MRELHITDPAATQAFIDTVAHDVVLLQFPAVFAVIAAPTSKGVAALDRTKNRQPNKNYSTCVGDLEAYFAMVQAGTLPPELSTLEALAALRGTILRVTIAPETFNSSVVRNGTHQGLVGEDLHRYLFLAVEDALRNDVEPDLFAGHRCSSPLGSSANISGDPAGSITTWERAYAFGIERNIPLVIRCEPSPTESGSPTLLWLHRDSITVERAGPRLNAVKALLPAHLFAGS